MKLKIQLKCFKHFQDFFLAQNLKAEIDLVTVEQVQLHDEILGEKTLATEQNVRTKNKPFKLKST